ncbi:hypothetical protein [Deefgea sp. CFH1-16]|uniref:hypothetical protein n=1 Tax=Deefgea sp. CFH1-16 TaxID=2675457 RepID=UPI0019402E5E|nr:hypothetical protein [Deefgea sp. CFH1-16]
MAAKKAEKAAKDAGESVPSPVVAPAAVEKPAIDEEKAAKIRAAMAAAAAKKAAKPAAEGKE